MSLKYGLLGLLNYGEMSGYDLDKAFNNSVNIFWQAQTSQIYRELSSMEKLNWIEAEIVIQHSKPNKKIYKITKLGESELIKWLRKDKNKDFFKMRNSFLLMIFFSGEKPIDENIEMLKKFKQCCLGYFEALKKADENIEYYSNMVDDVTKRVYWDITANFGRANMTATLQWIDDSIMRLEGLK